MTTHYVPLGALETELARITRGGECILHLHRDGDMFVVTTIPTPPGVETR